MGEVSKEDLEKEIEKILKDADLAKTSTRKVTQKLEKIFDTDLTDKKGVIDELVMNFVNKNDSDSSEEDKDDEEEEEEEEKKPPKRAAKRPAKPTKAKKKRKTTSSGSEASSDDDADGDYKEPKKKKGGKKGGGGGGKGSGYTKACKLSPALAELFGEESLPRHEVVKRMWAVIKEKNLHDPNNRQFAICDEALYKVIGTKRFRIFGMMKYLKNHFLD